MCGIYYTNVKYSDDIVADKLNTINHRGPDNSTILKKKNMVFGHNRLSIIDTDSRANQPFQYGDITLIFNGEIYNYKELRSTLISKNYTFITKSDTEVLAAYLSEFWEKGLSDLNGMFAIVAYSDKKKKLLVVKDRFGQKPVYYKADNSGIEIASQIKQIALGKSLDEDQDAMRKYFLTKYIPAPRTCYNQIKKLEAGEYMEYCILKNEVIRKETFYDIAYNQDIASLSYHDAKYELKRLLTESVNYRLIADVPLGVFLSGGIDSSLVTAIASNIATEKIKTFSIKFDEARFDESIYAKEIANHLGTDHTTIPCNIDEGLNIITDISKYFDEPFADASAIPTMLLCKHTRQHVTVALSGDAGDEVFLGYNRYAQPKWQQNLYRAPFVLRNILGKAIANTGSNRAKALAEILRQKDLSDLYLRSLSPLDLSWMKNPEYDIANIKNEYLQFGDSRISGFGAYDLKTYLPDEINVKVDRASMAYSLECRAPLIDHNLVNFGLNLDTKFRFGQGKMKKLLKDVTYDFVPEQLLNRPKKGFTMPLESWFRNELKEFVLDTLSLSSLKDIPYINAKRCEDLINQHIIGKTNKYVLIWKLLMYKSWKERYC
jgi:asparagine synthase (glutamine-hydrolysing)